MIKRIAFVLMFFCFPMQGWAGSSGIKITGASVWIQDATYLVDLTLDYNLPDKVLDALDHGVPLVFIVSLRVERPRKYWWRSKVKQRSYKYRVRFRPLSSLYEVEESQQGEMRRFVTKDAVFAYLSELQQLEVIAQDELEANKSYLLALKSELDIESLPPPMRPMAYLTPSWNQSSGWSRWPLRQ